MLVVYWSYWIVYLMSIEGGRAAMLTLRWLTHQSNPGYSRPCGLKSSEKVKWRKVWGPGCIPTAQYPRPSVTMVDIVLSLYLLALLSK